MTGEQRYPEIHQRLAGLISEDFKLIFRSELAESRIANSVSAMRSLSRIPNRDSLFAEFDDNGL